MRQMNNSDEQALEWYFNIPNAVTITRVVLAIIIAWLLWMGGAAEILMAGILLSIAWATDGLDGYLARRLRQTSLVGALFDLLADRVLMTPTLILALTSGLFSRAAAFMPFYPYPYAVVVIAGDLTVAAGVFVYLWKRRSRVLDFPTPTQIAKITYSVQMLTLVVCVLGIGPDILLAVLMYLSIIFTLLSFFSYLRKGGYVFTS